MRYALILLSVRDPGALVAEPHRLRLSNLPAKRAGALLSLRARK